MENDLREILESLFYITFQNNNRVNELEKVKDFSKEGNDYELNKLEIKLLKKYTTQTNIVIDKIIEKLQ